jgi:predicted Holliday junction resolvase-like endonuclease
MDVFVVMMFLFLSFIFLFIGFFVGKWIERYKVNKEWEEKIPQLTRESVEKSREVLGGKFAEKLAPYFPNFKYDPTELRFIGEPIDYIVFRGASTKNPSEIIFLEVKSGDANLTPVQKKWREVIESKKISWEVYRVPKEVTKKEVEQS